MTVAAKTKRARRRIDPERGIVYSAKGVPMNARSSRGYVISNENRRCQLAHRMIWEYVHGPIPAGLEINHINGIKHDNRIANLELVTPSQNVAHAYHYGLMTAVGEHNGRAKLTPSDVREIRKLLGVQPQREIAERFVVSRGAINGIAIGRNWSHVT